MKIGSIQASELTLTHDTHRPKVLRISPVNVTEERLDISMSPHNFEILFSFPNFLKSLMENFIFPTVKMLMIRASPLNLEVTN